MQRHQILQEAAEWILKLQQAPLNQREQLDFEQWKNQSPEHQTAWQKAERLLLNLGEFPADGQVLIEQSQKQGRHHLSKHFLVAFMLCIGGTVLWTSDTKEYLFSDYSTSTGQQKNVELQDGTKVYLNTHTAFDVNYNARERVIRLHYGEIQINTAKEQTPQHRPFFVETESARLQALGTVFNVQYLKKHNDETCLGVIESAVKVNLNHSTQSKVIQAGEQICFDSKNFKTLQPLHSNMSAWQNGVVMAFEMPLDQLLQEIARHHHQYIDIAPELKALKVSGSYPVNDFNALKSALEMSYPVKVEHYLGHRIVKVSAQPQK